MPHDPDNAVETALSRARTDPLARPQFYRMLMSEVLFVCGEIEGNAGRVVSLDLQRRDGLSIAIVRHNGRSFHPIFSSMARLEDFFGRPLPHFSMVGREIFRRSANADFVLNPNTDCGKELRAGEIAFWLDPSARARRTLANNPPRVLLSDPADYPRKLVDAFRILFASRSDVVAAHLLYVAFSDRAEPPHPLIGILTTGAWAKISAEVSELTEAVLPDTIIDLVPLDGPEINEGLSGALRKIPPFYVRPGAGHVMEALTDATPGR